MASFTKNIGYLAKWIRKLPVRSGKLSNFRPAGSIPLGQKFGSTKKTFLTNNETKNFWSPQGQKSKKILELFPWGDAINRIPKTDTFLKELLDKYPLKV